MPEGTDAYMPSKPGHGILRSLRIWWALGAILAVGPIFGLFAAQWLQGSPGALVIVFQLVGWRMLAAISSSEFADHHSGLALLFGFMLYVVPFVLPAVGLHRLLARHPRTQRLALLVAAAVYVALVCLLFPVTGIPV